MLFFRGIKIFFFIVFLLDGIFRFSLFLVLSFLGREVCLSEDMTLRWVFFVMCIKVFLILVKGEEVIVIFFVFVVIVSVFGFILGLGGLGLDLRTEDRVLGLDTFSWLLVGWGRLC